MKLRSVHIAQFRCFGEPFTLDGLADGLNLFAAPNESGKSTVAEAIRAAFFERHRSSSVEYLRPWGDASATPTVEVEFQIDGRHYLLSKTFLGRKRCTLDIEGQPSLDGAAAEDHLADLLGFRFPGKGASSAEHMGIPGLLWVRQGGSQDLAEPVSHAADHLRHVLGESLGELTSVAGDTLLSAVEGARNELLTPAAGKPRGAYSAALERRTELETSVGQLTEQVVAYQASVDRLTILRRDHQRDDHERPWAGLQQQHQSAQTRLTEAQGLETRYENEQATLRQHRAQVESLRAQLESFDKESAAVTTRSQAVQAAEAAEIAVLADLDGCKIRHEEAVAFDTSAHQQLQRMRAAMERAEMATTAQELESALGTLATTLKQAREASERAARLNAEADALQISPTQLKALKHQSESLREIGVRLEAVATMLEFNLLDGRSLRVDTEILSGQARRTIVSTTQIQIEGVGRITVSPGAADLDALTAQRERLQIELATRLKQLGVANVAEAEERARRTAQCRQDAKGSQKLLDVLAPQGVQAIETDLAVRRTRLDELRRTLDSLPIHEVDDRALPDRITVESQAQRAADALKSAAAARGDARIAAAKAQSDLAAARQELAAAVATANDPQRIQRLGAVQQALNDALAQEAAATHRVDDIGRAVQDIKLDLLRQDVDRLAASARQLEDTHARRRDDITRLESELQTKGALGLEEQRAEHQRELEAATRRADELGRRANALDHLLSLLREKRSELARRLRAPLQRHLDRNLQLLFPGAHIEIADDLSPGPISRIGARGEERGDFDQLSMGTREQMGIIARLAYADLLQEAGKPTLLILDDALVNSDEDRLGQMKRVLYDAAQRHQILIFTCHPAAWRDLGVPQRPLQRCNP